MAYGPLNVDGADKVTAADNKAKVCSSGFHAAPGYASGFSYSVA